MYRRCILRKALELQLVVTVASGLCVLDQFVAATDERTIGVQALKTASSVKFVDSRDVPVVLQERRIESPSDDDVAVVDRSRYHKSSAVDGLVTELRVAVRARDRERLRYARREDRAKLLLPHIYWRLLASTVVVLELPVARDGPPLARLVRLRRPDRRLPFAPLLGVLVHVEGPVVDLVALLRRCRSLVGVE